MIEHSHRADIYQPPNAVLEAGRDYVLGAPHGATLKFCTAASHCGAHVINDFDPANCLLNRHGVAEIAAHLVDQWILFEQPRRLAHQDAYRFPRLAYSS